MAGVSLKEGRAEILQIDDQGWDSFFWDIDAWKEGMEVDWKGLTPSPPLVEFFVVPDQSAEYCPADRGPFDVPPYTALLELARRLPDQERLGAESLAACLAPDPATLDAVRDFTARYGLLNWGDTEHDCFPEDVEVAIGRLEPCSWRVSSSYCLIPRNAQNRYINSVVWILREALVLRRAAALFDAITRVRVGNNRAALDRLWGIERGKVPVLWDEHELPVGSRLDLVVDVSTIRLSHLIDAHLAETQVAAFLIAERWPRARKGTFRAYWIRAGTRFKTPLVGLWLGFFNDLLSISGDRECAGCGIAFSPGRSDQRYCGKLCGARVRNRNARERKQSRMSGHVEV